MLIAFMDEFGHIGPFLDRKDPKHNTSPVFGIGGIVLPSTEVRNFSVWFYKQKCMRFAREIESSRKHPSTWEKKGSSVFTPHKMASDEETRRLAMRLLGTVRKMNGSIVYYGREKWQAPEASKPGGLYTTVLAHTIRCADACADGRNEDFMMILDQHDDRLKHFTAAAKTMFGARPARRLLEPPLQAESHLYNSVQAADWICTLLGRLWAFRLCPQQYPDYADFEKYLGRRVDDAAIHSLVARSPARRPIALQHDSLEPAGV